MSHLTTSILNRPSAFNQHHHHAQESSPFEFPGPRAVHPLSPPDTDDDFSLGAQQTHKMAPPLRPLGLGLDVGDGSGLPSAPSLGTPNSRLKKMSYVHAQGHHQGRERAQPKSKWLVVVIPPPAMVREHGQLGHTLAHGPSSRLSNGVLMPLFPTMYAQLTAIAREFNFPSTTGLCLYLHMVDNGLAFTPRVSDETWQLLWGALLDSHASAGGLPIGGRLEFDVDRHQARWYEPWLASAHRLSIDNSPTAPRSVAHRRHDSRTEVADDDDAVSVAPKARTHIPRKLSLVDRFDTMSVRSNRGGGNGRPSVVGAFGQQEALAPIVQVDEPKTAKLALESRVRSWRQSATVAPGALAALGQPSLDAVNLPNAVDVPDVPELTELNLADFTWSVSSAGPPSDAAHSPAMEWYSPAASVHMDRRAEGSVLLTPTTVSSLGPADYSLGWSPISPMARLPSPDLAWRMMDDVPPTPTTVSSQGPADYDPEWSPQHAYHYASSPDLAWRAMEDVPPTPTTASSLGPPASWPASPVMPFRAHTPDLGARALHTAPPTPVLAAFAPVVEAAAWGHVWPHVTAPAYPTWGLVWPYNAAQTASAVAKKSVGYPHFDLYPAVRRTGRVKEARAPGYPFFEVYPAAYPSFELYPAPAAGRQTTRNVSVKLAATYPNFDIYASTYPNLEIYPGHRNKNVEIAAPHAEAPAYPWMNVYFAMAPAAPIRGPAAPAVYPFFDLYPTNAPLKIVDAHPLGYPYLQLYSAVAPSFVKRPGAPMAYPLFDLYPANAPIKVADAHPLGYPYLQLYAAVAPSFVQRPGAPVAYPMFDLYPAVVKPAAGVKVLLAPTAYPRFDLYPAPAPAFGKGPVVVSGIRVNYPKFDLYPEAAYYAPKRGAVHVLLAPSVYPALVVYPAVQYPANLLEIYGPSVNDDLYFKARSTRLQKRGFPTYPKFDLYPEVSRKPAAVNPIKSAYKYPFMCIYKPAYPHFDLYPSAEVAVQPARKQSPSLGYPTLVIYPAVERPEVINRFDYGTYPALVIYAPVHPVAQRRQVPVIKGFNYGSYPNLVIYPSVQRPEAVKHFSHGTYPALVIYAVVYPAFDVYPTVQRSETVKHFNHGTYPALVIYAAVYPAFDVYPTVQQPIESCRALSVKLPARYPAFDIYSPVYPCFRIYGVISKEEDRRPAIAVRLAAKYPAIALYEPVYPHLEIYPGAAAAQTAETVATWSHVWPYVARKATPTTWGHVWPYAARSEPATTWSHVWPYAAAPAAWGHVWPYAEETKTWSHVWPYAAETTTWSHVWPYAARSTSWSHVWPYAQRAAFWIPRFSHEQLRAQVLAEMPWVPRKSHEQLHNEVFPEGIVATPVTMQELLRSPARASPSPSTTSSPALVRRVSTARARSGTVSARPLSGLPVGPAFPESVSPSRSSSIRRVSPAAPSLPPVAPPPAPPAAVAPPTAVPSSRPLPSRPAGLPSGPRAGLPSSPAVLRRTSMARPMSVLTTEPTSSSSLSLPPIPPLSPLGEDEVAERSRTVRPEYAPAPTEGSGLSRSKTTNENTYRGAPAHVRRVSLVMERAKAYGATTNTSTKQEMMSTLSQFPLPPPPQISTGAPVVSKLDRSKFAAFSGARP